MSLMECVLGKWLRHRVAALVKGLTKGAPKPYRPRRVRLCLEILEDRIVPAPAPPPTYLVTQNNDDGTGKAGTLSAAINYANANQGTTINFAVGALGSAQTINITGNGEPALQLPTTINGYSQSGNNPPPATPLITLNGAGVKGLGVSGLEVDAGGVTVQGLAIENFTGGAGITLANPSGSAGDVLQGNVLGALPASGGAGNGTGIAVLGNNNTIGGSGQGQGNYIVANSGQGVSVSGTSNSIAGNSVGVGPNGAVLGNGIIGILLGGGAYLNSVNYNVISNNKTVGIDVTDSGTLHNMLMGNTVTANGTGILLEGGSSGTGVDGNVISGNASDGIRITAPEEMATLNVIQDNDIGVQADGLTAQGNAGNGIVAGAGADWNQILGNVVSSNDTGWTQGDALEGGVNLASDYNSVSDNKIGTDVNATVARANLVGVLVSGQDNTIGGGTGQGNVVSGNNNRGIELDGDANLVEGNLVGTNGAGMKALANQASGVVILGNSNTIGGTAVNIISGNAVNGVSIYGGDSNLLNGDYIGTDVSGSNKLGNGEAGIYLYSNANDNTIGAPIGANGNPSMVISGNGLGATKNRGYGIFLDGGNDSDNLIQGSYIGVDVTGLNPLGNAADGIFISGTASSANTIGGAAAGAGNVISANAGYGVNIGAGDANNVVQNNIIGLNKNAADPFKNMGNSSGWQLDNGTNDQWIGNQHQ
jgi:hypothetical protein